MKNVYVFQEKRDLLLLKRKLLLVMKLTTIILLAVCMGVSAKGFSQTITYSGKNVPLKKVFSIIEHQTGHVFFYNDAVLSDCSSVSVCLKHAKLSNALAEILRGQDLRYYVKGKTIFLQKTSTSSLPVLPPILRNKPTDIQIHGTVKDSATGEPLIGVTIRIKGSSKGTTTDVNGEFDLEVNPSSTLIVSFVGYITKTVLVNNRNVVNINLSSSAQSLEQLTVVGFGIQKAKDVTGSVSTVSPEELNEAPVATFAEALQGKASGVYVSTSGAPGSGSTIRVRGVGSINGSDPLVVVDGVSNVSIDAVDPNDIESISVLKDASATAIYGAQGANGVIIITTKQGSKDDKIHVSYNAYFGVSKMANNGFDLLNGWEAMEFQAEGLKILRDYRGVTSGLSDLQFGSLDANDQLAMPYSIKPAGLSEQEIIDRFGSVQNWVDSYKPDGANSWSRSAYYQMLEDGYSESEARKGTDWYKLIKQTGFTEKHDLSLRGGSNKASYSMSFNYLNYQGTVKSSYFKRYSLRVNTTFHPFKFLSIGQNSNFSAIQFGGQRGTQGDATIFAKTYTIQPWVPVYNIGGDFAGSQAPNGGRDVSAVELASEQANDWTKGYRGQAALFAEVKPIAGLTIRTQYSVRLFGGYSSSFTPITIPFDKEGSPNNSLSQSAHYNLNWQWTNTATYNKSFGESDFTFLLGTEALREHAGRDLGANRIDYIFENDPNTYTIDNGASHDLGNSGSLNDLSTLFGVFGRIDYSLSDKYLATVTVRRDASSKFSDANRWGTFPSASLGWRISEEPFFASLKNSFINDLKIRLGYGTSGNSHIGAYNYATQYATGDGDDGYLYAITGTDGSVAQGYSISNLGDPNAKWETIRTLNAGIDASLFNYKLSLGLDFYIRKTTDMLVPANWSALAGMSAKPSINIGDMRNEGFDFNLGYKDKIGDFSYNLNLTLSENKNTVLRLGSSDIFHSTRLNDINITTEGKPVGLFYGYKVIGLYKSEDDVLNYKDSKGNTVVPYGVADLASLNPKAFVGRYKLQDVNGDGRITADDRTFIGNPQPDLTGGLHISLGYKDFDLSTFLFTSVGNDIYRHYMYYTFYAALQSAYSKDRRDKSWNPVTNPNGIYPLYATSSGEGNEAANESNSMYVQDGSYLRMQNLILGYTLPGRLTSKIRLDKIRVYFQVSNVFTITNYDGLDPEIRNYNDLERGIDYGSYGIPRRFLFGFNINF